MFPPLGQLATILAMLQSAGSSPGADTTRVDHLILGINNLERGTAEFARLTGVTPVFGGQHPGRGTANALASLGNGLYIEILGPSSTHPDSIPANLAGLTTLTPIGWALGTNDLTRVTERLRGRGFTVTLPQAGSRRRPDNSMLSWRTAAVTGPGLERAPFIIEWGAGTAHPASTSPKGCTLTKMGVTELVPGNLGTMLQVAGLNLTVERGDPPGLSFNLTCPKGEVNFGRAAG